MRGRKSEIVMSTALLLKKKRIESLRKFRLKSLKKHQSIECPECGKEFDKDRLKDLSYVCDSCKYYFGISAYDRLEMLLDYKSFKEMKTNMITKNPLDFPGYEKKLMDYRKNTGLSDAIVTGVGKISGVSVAIGVLDSNFLMGSMGTVVGEKIALLAEYAGKKKLPLIIFSASGGARMQEGLFSLMQMAKTTVAIEKYRSDGGLFISYLTNPTTGGVSASYASLGDIIIAEPGALICFAGPRVIEQTIGQTLPSDFQRAEFLLKHGMIDMVVKRGKMRNVLIRILHMHGYK